MRTLLSLLCLIFLAALAGTTGCSAPSASPSAAPASPSVSSSTTSTAAPGLLVLHVDALDPGSLLPDMYTCKGTSESPALSWSNTPSGTKSFVLILDDPDAPAGTFTHWLVYNIPPGDGSFSRAQQHGKVLENGAHQGDTSGGSRGYYPPCPPIGTTHRYVFRLYAVDMEISQPAANRASIDAALSGHIVGQAEFVTRFTR